MEKPNMSYETLFIVDLSNGDDAAKAVVEKFKALIEENGTVKEFNEWGKRRLAYPINDLLDGYYVLCTFEAPAAFPTELERLFNINDSIMRSMVIRTEE